jgi:hypothetical protein
MSYTFLQEQGEESSAACFSDIPAFVLSRLSLTAGKSYCNASGTECCQNSQSGMISEHSTGDRGADSLTLCAADSHAKTSAQPAKAQASTASEADCGERWLGWFAKWDRASCSWKTPQCSLLAGLDEFSGTWPRWGMMRNGVCWELSTPERHTDGSESGFWPTPLSSDWNPRGPNSKQQGLSEVVKMWPTPRANESTESVETQNARIARGTKASKNLTAEAKRAMWPTPCASDNRDRGHVGMPAIQRRVEIGKQIGLGQSVSETSVALNPDWVEWLMG